MRNTFRVLFYIKRTAPRRNGDVPVMARITINGERAQLAVRAYVNPALWDVRTGLAAGRSAAASELNEKLLLVRRRIERCYETLLARQAAVTPALVREMYFGNDRQQETLLAFFRQHNEEFGRMVGVSRSKSSYYKYRSVYRLLAAYVRERCRRADIPFRELDKRFLAGFHQYIARESPHKKNTAWVYMIAFKHILMLARSRDLLSADLFAGYRLRSEFVARDYLTETEIRRLMLLAPTDRTQRLVLDAFLFSCFTGLSYIDIRQLKPANIRYTQGQLWIGTTRRKTGSEVYVRLFAVPNAILSRYLTDAADEPIFALPSNGWCNACLRRLLPEAGIVRPITFHVARHTFATTITLSQGVAIETISKLLGHRNIRTTQIYAAVTHAKLEGDMERLSRQLDACYRL